MTKYRRQLLKKSTLFILPITFIVVALLIHFGKGKFYLLTVDPEYFHLFNGLNLAIFNLAVDFIHHPGTTVQIIFAISAHMVNLIQPENNIITNALNNPEDFIHGANILLNILTSTTLVFLGLLTYRYTNNIGYAFLVQLMPFGSYKIVLMSGRLIPEAALIAPILLLTLLMVRYLYDNKRKTNITIYLIGFAITGGLGIAGKLLYLPFLVIPLFIIPTLKLKLKYVAFTCFAIIVFAFPVFVNIGKSWEWFGSMFMHSGKWGSGEQNFIDFQTVPKRLSVLFNIDRSFIVILGLAICQLITYSVLSFFNKNISSNLNMKMLFGVIAGVVFSILMVTKHFEIHYFFPTLMFKGLILFLMTKLLVDVINTKLATRIISASSLIIMLILVFYQKDALAIEYQNYKTKAEYYEERANIVKQFNISDYTLIISSNYRGSPFIESALVAGVLMSGHLKTTFIDELAEMYPNTYFYYDWSDRFYFWDHQKNAGEFIDIQKPTYIFIGKDREEGFEVIMERLQSAFPHYGLEVKLLHQYADPIEHFYEVRFVKQK